MPDIKIDVLPKSEVKIAFTVSPDEARPYLDEAVRELSSAKPIPGFRPGMAGFEEAKRFYGEMTIWEHALECIVRALYVRTVLAEKIDTIGSPSVNVDKLVPGQPIEFTVIAPTAPKVTTFPDLAACKIERKEKPITDERINETINDMRRMRRVETVVERSATMDDLVIIDLEMKKDHVILEGGSGKNYRVYLSEDHYVPGFTKQLEGIKKGETRTFSLAFPTEHFQKHLAGQTVDFTATTQDVYALELPEANDDFAKAVGIENIEKLRERLRENLALENKARADEAAEIEMLEKLVEAARFSDVPDLLVNEEVKRMIHELEHGVEEQGMSWPDYLASIKKTMDELKLSFAAQALKRIQTAVLIKGLAKRENVVIEEKEVDAEIDRVLAGLKEGDAETRERVTSVDYREYMAVQMRNRKTLEWLKRQCIV